MKKLTILMLTAAVVMAVAAAALVAAVRFAADTAPEIVDSAADRANASVASAFESALTEISVDSSALSGDVTPLDGNAATGTAATATPTTVATATDADANSPVAGTAMAVVGVRWDDVLNLRDAPNGYIVARLSPVLSEGRGHEIDVLEPESDVVLAVTDIDGVIAVGNTESLSTTVWHLVNAGGIVGWVSDAYLAPLGRNADDLTDLLQRNLDQSVSYDTIAEIEQRLGEVFEVVEPESGLVVASPVGFFEGTGVHWLDVIGVSDQRLRGYRVGVAVQAGGDWMVPDAATSAGPFTVLNAWATELCINARGTNPEGECR